MNQNKQQWLIDTISTDWEDKVELIPNLLFTCLIHFVEKENGLSQLYIDWTDALKHRHTTQDHIDNINNVYGELQAVYNYVKNERPLLLIDFENSYPTPIEGTDIFESYTSIGDGVTLRAMKTCEEIYGMSFEEAYSENTRCINMIKEKDQWAMSVIIKNVGYLWT